MSELDIWRSNQIERLKKDMDRMFDRVWGEFGFSVIPRSAKEFPYLDLTETDDKLVIKADIPGMDPNDLEISVSDDSITLKSEISQELVNDSERFHRTERMYGSFLRTIRLPCRIIVDDVKADYSHGILEISMPKCPEKRRLVSISCK
ncbi:MAG: Hsp20/alpha crystallin family protein [Deltaproteobacteria bacterium]|nr:Hsp20/alpha crystallin family protein [Deltaproteobacteria bacterium]